MAGWQRRARFVIGTFALVFGLIVFLAIRERAEPTEPAAIDRADPDAVVETTSTEIEQTRGAERDFRVEAQRQLTYEDGAVRLVEVTVRVPEGADHGEFTVSGREGEVFSNQKAARVTGDVRLAVSDGLRATAEKASYDDRDKIVRMPGPVQVERETMQAFGVGATYEGTRDILRLLEQAHVTVFGGAGGKGLDITASSAILADRDQFMRFDGGVTMTSVGQVTKANAALAHFREEMSQIEMIELYGDSRLTREGLEVGSLRDMRADDMTLEYAEDGQSIKRTTLVGSAVIELAGSDGQRPRRIVGESMNIRLGPDGLSVTRLVARDAVQVDLPGEDAAPAQRIRAATLRGTGEPGVGLTAAHFEGAVEYYETHAATALVPAIERVTRARVLDVTLKPGFSAVEEARFAGDVTFEDGPVTAEAENARSDVVLGIIELLSDPTVDRTPSVVDERGSVTATRIELALEGGAIIADGEVQSVLKNTGANDGSLAEPADADQARLPAILDQHEAVYVTGGHFERDGQSALAEYTGEARLWQGDTEVRASTIVLDERQGNLSAAGSVETKSPGVRHNEETGEPEPTTIFGWGEQLVYDDALRRTTYTTAARVDGPAGDLRADRIELYGGGREDTLERVEAYETVTVELDGRWASGARLTYTETDGRYELSGSPVRILEQLAEECRETTGRTLTFFRSIDTIIVDGNAEIRTQSTQTTSGICPEPQLD